MYEEGKNHLVRQPAPNTKESIEMEAVTSFSARRPAAGSLPAFSLPPPTSEVPRASDGLSPSLSSVHTGSSQGSQAPTNMQYTYSHGGWPTPGGSTYNVNSGAGAQQPMGQSPYGGRSMYAQANMPYGNQRNSQSPATGGEALPAPPYDQVHQQFQPSGAHDGHPSMQSGTMLTHNSTQPPTPSSAPAHVDSYAHSRQSGNTPNYTSSAPHHQPNFSYATQTSPTNHSSNPNGPLAGRLGSLSNQGGPQSMAPPASYRPYPSYQPLSTMSGPVMSNIHQPGGQLSMIPGMVPAGYAPPPHAIMYAHPQPQQQSERPFKCDQCVQSFSRNHDLKRHKRIHLAVKPFPCTFCSKSFSRKDALKRHRLVKGCETKGNENNNLDDANHRNGEAEDDGSGMRKSP